MVVTDISDKDGKNIKIIVFEQMNLILHKRIKLITDPLIRQSVSKVIPRTVGRFNWLLSQCVSTSKPIGRCGEGV